MYVAERQLNAGTAGLWVVCHRNADESTDDGIRQ
ncbi:hypothetical protein C499_03268 [Halogeometricum borinquense DSM 11551]|uniref:Uncharacterized protein n=1 Tax=Halogeometricum borinquense (strain ATCC 700274 / DSM 11551 / JCM 10706 / KCTC 4070 / PR3) TaxID=469382 RepID=E4NQQ6_HALBP|nr:hypothetical protein Hbor_11540 [Halogeometricum borinquense DSM 11551]ELY30253.1 hypothetical protein C499_03268 [Halogeometricum borinquense DSM 11551]